MERLHEWFYKNPEDPISKLMHLEKGMKDWNDSEFAQAPFKSGHSGGLGCRMFPLRAPILHCKNSYLENSEFDRARCSLRPS